MKETRGVGIGLVEVEYNFQRIREHLAGGRVVDDGEGVLQIPVCLRRRSSPNLLTDARDVRILDPNCVVGDSLEVERISVTPRCRLLPMVTS